MTVIRFPGHRWKRCKRGCAGCMFCDGGLSLCRNCGGFEGSMPTDCPGYRMTERTANLVYERALDYRRSEGWVNRPSKNWEGWVCR